MNEKIQLFLMPFAGGGQHSFDVLLPYLTDEFELFVFEYAGHGTRRKEPFYTSFGDMVKDAALFFHEKRENKPYAILGYSMGALVTYELYASGLVKEVPSHIFLASHDSPDSQWEGKQYYGMQEEDFIAILRRMGGMERVDEKTLSNKFFQRLYMEPIKEDYRLLAGYEMSRQIILPAKTTVFYAPDDITEERIRGWEKFMMQGSHITAIGENHFFYQKHACVFADNIIREAYENQ